MVKINNEFMEKGLISSYILWSLQQACTQVSIHLAAHDGNLTGNNRLCNCHGSGTKCFYGKLLLHDQACQNTLIRHVYEDTLPNKPARLIKKQKNYSLHYDTTGTYTTSGSKKN
jgi:hypothetical protein